MPHPPTMTFFKKKEMPEFALCETGYSTVGMWHIRKLTEAGLKTGGGADTKALCGAGVRWDFSFPIIEERLQFVCKTCRDSYLSLYPDSS